jgi:putative transposase
MKSAERKGRSGYLASELNTNNWPQVILPDSFSDDFKSRFERKKIAVTLYASGERIGEIKNATNFTVQYITRLFNNCMEIHEDGEIFGFRALVPYKHQNKYTRKNNLEGVGPGSFEHLLTAHPKIRMQLHSAFFGYDNSRLSDKELNDLTYFEFFMLLCREDGSKENEYPFNTDYYAKRSFDKYLKWLGTTEEGINAHSDRNSKRRLDLNREDNSIDSITRPYKNVAFDAHRVDASWFFYFSDKNGNIREQYLEGFWLLLILDEHSDTVLGYSISLYKKYNRFDVIRSIKNAILQPSDKLEPPHGLIIPDSVELPPLGTSSKLRYLLWENFKYDNDKANLSHDVVHTLLRLGSKVNAGPVAFPEARAILERFFQTLEELGFRYLPGTLGTGPDDKKRELAEKGAKVYQVTFEILQYCLNLSIRYHNARIRKRNFGMSPLQSLEQYVNDPNNIVLRVHPQKRDEISKFGLRYICTVRGNKNSGTRPYVQILDAPYTNQKLDEKWELVGKKITCYLQNNAQFAEAYDDTGCALGVLDVRDSKWRFPHTYENRMLVLKGRGEIVRDAANNPSPSLILNLALQSANAQKKAARIAQAVLVEQNQFHVSINQNDTEIPKPMSKDSMKNRSKIEASKIPGSTKEELKDAYDFKGTLLGGQNEKS